MSQDISARDVAAYFIQKSSEVNENDLTNLKLQKILFYTQAEHLHQRDVALFADPIEAWKYGPLVADVYNWLRGCGAYAITAFDIEADTEK